MSGITQALFMAAGSSPIQFVGVGTAATAASNSIGVPSGIRSGDLLLIVCSSGSIHTLTTTTGWNSILANPSSGSIRFSVWWKIADGSETANSVTSTQSRLRAVMFAWRNVASTPVDVAPSTATTGSSTSATPASVTTTVANDLVIGFASTATAGTYTYPSSVNQRYNVSSDGSVNGLIFWDELQASAGASTSRTATLSSSITWAAYSAAFKRA